ncbi:MAG TPA: DUF11 domain-containing protein [Anaerolineae bacterium]|nr:DUF11 domain-containing protein [Anaerolineae bacterium]
MTPPLPSRRPSASTCRLWSRTGRSVDPKLLPLDHSPAGKTRTVVRFEQSVDLLNLARCSRSHAERGSERLFRSGSHALRGRRAGRRLVQSGSVRTSLPRGAWEREKMSCVGASTRLLRSGSHALRGSEQTRWGENPAFWLGEKTMRKTFFVLTSSLALGLLLLLLVLASAGQPALAAPSSPTTQAVTACTPIGDARGMSGQTVTVCGRATMYTGGFYAGSGNAKFYVQDGTGGVQVQMFDENGTPLPTVALGDWVTVTGQIGAYRNEIQLVPADNPNDVSVTAGAPADVPAPLVKGLGEIGEETEGWLVRVQGRATRIQEYTYNWEMDLTDGQHSLLIYVDKNTGASLSGYQIGYTYVITGISTQYDANYQVKPRMQADIALMPSLLIEKEAPLTVQAGALLTYTIRVSNYTQISLTNLVVTDRLPITNAVLAYPLDGGTLMPGGVLSWTYSSLADGAAAAFRFVITATGELGDVISNSRYAVWAAEWVTHETGLPVFTFIGDYLPIYEIQGDGFRSPYTGLLVRTVGIVTGFFEGNSTAYGNFDGFYIQDPNGDGNDATSDGIFVKYATSVNPGVSIGDRVTVTGTVDEFSEWDGPTCSSNECQTQIYISSAAAVQINGTGSLSPTVLDPPGDPDAALVYFEAREGMLTTLPLTGAVVGPTSYGTIMVIPGDEGVDRVMRGGPYEGMPFGVRPDERYGSGAPNLIVGSVVTGVNGPLAYTYGNYAVSDQDGYTVVYSQPLPSPVPTWPAPGTDQFSAATFNTYNFDGEDGNTKLTKVLSTVINLGPPTWLALEEIATLPTCVDIRGNTVTGVISDLVAALAAQGYTYQYAASHPDVGCHGVAVLWDTARVSQVVTGTYQTCSASGSSSSTAYDHYCDGTGLYPLFSRRPVVVTGTVATDAGPVQMVVIGSHFKSKRGGSSADQRRLEQAQFVAGLVDSFVAEGTANALVMGDLNDFLDSPPLQALQASGNLTDTFYLLPSETRYSYIHLGVSQVLDHILVSPGLLSAVSDISPLHYNADFPYNPYSGDGSVVWRTSDHDPVAAAFQPAPDLSRSTKTVTPTGDVQVGDILTYTITLSNSGSVDAHVTLTDTLPTALWPVQGWPGLTWSGTVTAGGQVTLTLVVQATTTLTSSVTVSNIVTIHDGWNAAFDIHSPETSIRKPVWRVYLPLVLKNP